MYKSNYTFPNAYNAGGDIKKRWYVSYYFVNPETGLKKRFIIFGNINRHKTVKEKTKALLELQDELLAKLQNGFSPFSETNVSHYGQITVETCLRAVIQNKKTYQKKSAFVSTENKLLRFIHWLRINRINHIHPTQITKTHIFDFLTYLTVSRQVQNRTRNNFLVDLRSAFNAMGEMNPAWLINNPCLGIRPLPTRSERNQTFSNQQLARIKEWCEKNDPLLYKFCRCIMFLGLRPNEIAQVKIEHIDFENWTLTSPASIQKNGMMAKKLISEAHRIDFIGLESLPSNYYLFTCQKMGGPKGTTSDYFTKKFKRLKKELHLSRNHTMYAMRHTFAIHMMKSGVDLVQIMKVTGHKNLQSVQHYLQTYMDETSQDMSHLISNFF